MLAHTARIAVVATFLAAVFSQAMAEGPSVAALPAQGMVVLRNGEVIAGKITKTEDAYLVDLPHGRISVKQADVDLVCGSLEEGYRWKRATIQVGNVQNHLELAQWCLRHNLLGPASVELADATAADPKNPMIGALQHRLKMAMEPPPLSATKKSAAVAGPSNDELDRMLRGMPRAAIETFTQSVQPVLLNHCTTSGCHGSQSESGLRLYRLSAGAPTSRRTTQRNLYSVMKYIDLANPTESRLLTAASRPHGTVEHAIFTERQAAQYRHIVDWANQLAGRPASESPASVARRAPAEVVEPPTGETPPGVLSQRSGRAQPSSAGAALRKGTVPYSPNENRDSRRTGRRPGTPSRNVDDATPASFDQPADDPQDPEVFNRRYLPEKGKHGSSPQKP